MREFIACCKADEGWLRFQELKKIRDFAKSCQGNVSHEYNTDKLWWAIRNAKQNNRTLLIDDLDPINSNEDRAILSSLAEEFVDFCCVSNPSLNILTARIYLTICEYPPAAAQ
jgi:hypothetical protein